MSSTASTTTRSMPGGSTARLSREQRRRRHRDPTRVIAMAKQKIVWTALPYGRVTEGPLAGRLRVSIVVSPRLTPEAATEQQLGAPGFAEFLDWPKTLQ